MIASKHRCAVLALLALSGLPAAAVAPAAAAPSTPTVTDNFDGRTTLGTSWGTGPGLFTAPLLPTVGSGVLNTANAGGWTSAYYRSKPFGSGQEAYVTKRSAAPVGVGACRQFPGSPAAETGYSLELAANGAQWLWKNAVVGGVSTQTSLYENFTAAGLVGVGDRFGLKVTANGVETWRRPAGGAWQLLRSTPDAAAANCVGYLTVTGGGGTLDDFGGTGGAVPAPASVVTYPSGGTTVRGTSTFSAFTNAATVGVQFRIDGVNAGPEDTTPPFTASINSAAYADGIHQVTAVARGLDGRTATSPVISAAFRNTTIWSINGGADGGGGAPSDWDPIKRLGYRVERMDVGINDSPATVASRVAIRRAAGIKVILLMGIGYDFATKPAAGQTDPPQPDPVRAATVAKIQGIVNALTLSDIAGLELGNETSMAHGWTDAEDAALARNYGRLANDLGTFLNTKGIPYLVQGSRMSRSQPDWLWEMYSAAPNLHLYVDAWTLHPYGPPRNSALAAGTSTGLYDAVSDLERDLVVLRDGGSGRPAAGNGLAWFSIPRAVTEFGIASRPGVSLTPNNYGWITNPTYDQAAVALKQGVSCLLDFYRGRPGDAGSRLWGITLYHARDQADSGNDREQAFGAFRNNGTTEKGAYTQAYRDLLGFPATTCPAGGMTGIPQ